MYRGNGTQPHLVAVACPGIPHCVPRAADEVGRFGFPHKLRVAHLEHDLYRASGRVSCNTRWKVETGRAPAALDASGHTLPLQSFEEVANLVEEAAGLALGPELSDAHKLVRDARDMVRIILRHYQK
jgi:hypothetical protein